MSEIQQPEQPAGVSRRTVTKAMAWAVPAIAIAAPVPAFAASRGTVTFTGTGCKLPGNSNDVYKGYVFRMTASNTTASPITITITSLTLNGTSLGNATVINLNGCVLLGNPFQVPANTTLSNLALVTADGPNSMNGTLVVTFTVSGVGGSQQVSTTVSGLGPIQGSCTAFSETEANCINSVAGS